jgi:hypothetical protein
MSALHDVDPQDRPSAAEVADDTDVTSPGGAAPERAGREAGDGWGRISRARRALIDVVNGDRWGPDAISLDDLRVILAEYDRLAATEHNGGTS